MPAAVTIMITLGVANQRELADALALVPGISLNCGAPRLQPDGSYRLDLFGTAADAKALDKAGHVVAIDKGYGARARKALADVDKEDRFKGGTILPKGVGVLGRSRRSRA